MSTKEQMSFSSYEHQEDTMLSYFEDYELHHRLSFTYTLEKSNPLDPLILAKSNPLDPANDYIRTVEMDTWRYTIRPRMTRV